MSTISANIIGGGISGLSTGIALKRIGYNVKIFDKAKHLETRKMGLTLQPYAFESLKFISPKVFEKTMSIAQRTGDVSIFSSNQKRLGKISDKFIESEFKYPVMTVPRDEFYNILLEEMDGHIHLGKFFKEFYQNLRTGEITAAFVDGSRERSDILVSAEGFISNAAKQIPLPYTINYRGVTDWRGIAEGVPLSEIENYVGIMFGDRKVSGIVPMKDNKAYWWVQLETRGGPIYDPNGDHHAVLEELLVNWHHGPLKELIKRSPQIFNSDIYDKTPHVRTWGRGNVTFVGESVHMNSPIFGYGADLCIEDAAVLSKILEDHKDFGTNLQVALRKYEDAREEKTRHMTIFARRCQDSAVAVTKRNQFLAKLAVPFLWPFLEYRGIYRALSCAL